MAPSTPLPQRLRAVTSQVQMAGSLGVEEKAGGGLSRKAFPKGLPTHRPGQSQIQASF